ncbi:MAG: hypothetical protein M3447_13415 [Acidobacteriota bacterium]|nr:hypothetical protein [Acidobacteriota bacterium]
MRRVETIGILTAVYVTTLGTSCDATMIPGDYLNPALKSRAKINATLRVVVVDSSRVFLRTRLLRLIINDFADLEIGDRVAANNLWRFGDERAKTSL